MPETREFIGVGLAFHPQQVYYFSDLTPELAEFIGKCRWIGHNLKEDAHTLEAWGVKVEPNWHLFADTMLMSYCVSTTKDSHGLKNLMQEEFGWEWPKYKELLKQHKAKDLRGVPVDVVAQYNAMDTAATLRLAQHLRPRMTSNTLAFYAQLEMPVMRLLFEMERTGALVDVEQIRKLDVAFGAEAETLLKQLVDFVGPVPTKKGKKVVEMPFNPGSPKQVTERLFTKLGIQEDSSNSQVLHRYPSLDPIRWLTRYREVTKLKSTYTTSMLQRPTLPLVHTTFNQVSVNEMTDSWKGIRTGRLSSSDPNLQNIPTRTETGNQLRRIFVAPEGFVIVGADYSQIEYRILAHYTKQVELVKAFIAGVDVHEETGKMFGVDRKLGKTLNFAAIYGAQAKRMAATARIAESQAQELLTAYWNRLPQVSRWISNTKFQARRRQGTMTLMGRWIPLPGINSPNPYEVWHWERAAVNYRVQGGAAEIMKRAMIRLSLTGQWGKKFIPFLQVHDELLCYVREQDADEVAALIKNAMESVVNLAVPLVVDVGIGRTWDAAKQ